MDHGDLTLDPSAPAVSHNGVLLRSLPHLIAAAAEDHVLTAGTAPSVYLPYDANEDLEVAAYHAGQQYGYDALCDLLGLEAVECYPCVATFAAGQLSVDLGWVVVVDTSQPCWDRADRNEAASLLVGETLYGPALLVRVVDLADDALEVVRKPAVSRRLPWSDDVRGGMAAFACWQGHAQAHDVAVIEGRYLLPDGWLARRWVASMLARQEVDRRHWA